MKTAYLGRTGKLALGRKHFPSKSLTTADTGWVYQPNSYSPVIHKLQVGNALYSSSGLKIPSVTLQRQILYGNPPAT